MKIGQAIKHRIEIKPSANKGFIVKVGCGTFVFPNSDTLIMALSEYLNTPDAHERLYNKACGGPISEQPTDPETPDEACDNA